MYHQSTGEGSFYLIMPFTSTASSLSLMVENFAPRAASAKQRGRKQ
jgi:hypothetical protein